MIKVSEKQKQFRERRFKEGFNNPKKDAWARRSRPIRKSVSEKIKDLSSNIGNSKDLKVLKPNIFKRIWWWVRSFFQV